MDFYKENSGLSRPVVYILILVVVIVLLTVLVKKVKKSSDEAFDNSTVDAFDNSSTSSIITTPTGTYITTPLTTTTTFITSPISPGGQKEFMPAHLTTTSSPLTPIGENTFISTVQTKPSTQETVQPVAQPVAQPIAQTVADTLFQPKTPSQPLNVVQLGSTQITTPQGPKPTDIRYVKINSTGRNYLNISQLVVSNSAGVNVAKGKPVSGSGTMVRFDDPIDPTKPLDPSKLVDGNESVREWPNIYHSAGEDNVNVMVDLIEPQSGPLTITIYNRASFEDRLSSFQLELYGPSNNLIVTKPLKGVLKQTYKYEVGASGPVIVEGFENFASISFNSNTVNAECITSEMPKHQSENTNVNDYTLFYPYHPSYLYQ